MSQSVIPTTPTFLLEIETRMRGETYATGRIELPRTHHFTIRRTEALA